MRRDAIVPPLSTIGCRRLRLTLQDQNQVTQSSEQPQSQLTSEDKSTSNYQTRQRLGLVPPSEEKVEYLKVYLESHKQREVEHQQSVKMLTDEVSQIQEVRYCLKTLREQMAARKNNNNNKVRENSEDSAKLREVSKRLYAQLRESEKTHQEERDRLQTESGEFSRHLDKQSKQLQRVEREAEERGQRVEELERLLGGMELEGAVLRDKMAASEAELLQLRAAKEGKQQRTEELEKELAVLKEKIHHLDDMLKSQQRKVRHMIEQMQNSRTVIQERDRMIRDLEEKVAFLEAENTEMHDQMEYFLEGQKPASPPSKECKPKPQIVYSKLIKPSSMEGNKTLPLIRVIEVKS